MLRTKDDGIAFANAYAKAWGGGKGMTTLPGDPNAVPKMETLPGTPEQPNIMNLYDTPESRKGYAGAMAGSLATKAGVTPTTPGSTTTQGASPGFKFTNDYLEQASKLMTQLGQIMTTGFSYNPQTDPSYLAAVSAAKEGAVKAKDQTYADMADRGILDSSVGRNQVAEINTKAETAPLQMIPGLEANAYGRYQNNISNQMGMVGQLLNEGHWQADQPFKEAAVTGRYLPDGAQALIEKVIGAKQAWGGASKEQQTKLRQDGIDARNGLAALGIDAEKLFGPTVGLSDSYANAGKAGMLTAGAQSDLLNSIMGLTSTFGKLPGGASAMLANSPLYGGIGNMMKGLEGTPTMEQNRFDLSKEEFTFRKEDAKNQDAIQWASHNLAKKRFDQEKDKSLLDANSKKATAGYVTQILGGNVKTREDAMSYIVEHAPSIVSDNADIGAIFDAVDQKYPKPQNAKDAPADKPPLSPTDIIGLNDKAMSAAQKDGRWPSSILVGPGKGKTPDQIKQMQDALVEEYKQKLLSGVPSGN